MNDKSVGISKEVSTLCQEPYRIVHVFFVTADDTSRKSAHGHSDFCQLRKGAAEWHRAAGRLASTVQRDGLGSSKGLELEDKRICLVAKG